jgi:hypothetical protein
MPTGSPEAVGRHDGPCCLRFRNWGNLRSHHTNFMASRRCHEKFAPSSLQSTHGATRSSNSRIAAPRVEMLTQLKNAIEATDVGEAQTWRTQHVYDSQANASRRAKSRTFQLNKLVHLRESIILHYNHDHIFITNSIFFLLLPSCPCCAASSAATVKQSKLASMSTRWQAHCWVVC